MPVRRRLRPLVSNLGRVGVPTPRLVAALVSSVERRWEQPAALSAGRRASRLEQRLVGGWGSSLDWPAARTNHLNRILFTPMWWCAVSSKKGTR